MSDDMQKALLILRLVAEGYGAASSVIALSKRAMDGDTITDAEIEAARRDVEQSVSAFDKAVESRRSAETEDSQEGTA